MHPFFYFLKNNQIFFDEEKSYIIIFNEGSIFYPARAFNKLIIDLVNAIGVENARKILKGVGIYQTEQALKRYKKIYNIDEIEKDKIIELLKLITGMIGIGKLCYEEVNYENNNKVFQVEFLPSTIFAYEAKLEYGKLSHNIDFLIEGLIEKALEALYGVPYECEEVKCYARGDEKCVFIAKPKSKL
ncbi:MAG: V4R domain-containing protein [Candidatus Aenigmatarchaeota archaeon]